METNSFEYILDQFAGMNSEELGEKFGRSDNIFEILMLWDYISKTSPEFQNEVMREAEHYLDIDSSEKAARIRQFYRGDLSLNVGPFIPYLATEN